ncbi:MAG TPA: hypothetical protein VK075_03715 [Pseudogracilibacillus sp.]|nr:hypothetical protein [Pseudogracilibacillus sp.]
MVKDERMELQIEREKEMRDRGISKMISEGGLGAEKYYHIRKVSSDEAEDKHEEDK